MPALLSLGKQSNLRGARRRLCVFLSQADSEGALPYDVPRCRDWEWDRDRYKSAQIEGHNTVCPFSCSAPSKKRRGPLTASHSSSGSLP